MVNCPKCGGLNPTTSQVCGNCGASLSSVNNNNNTTTKDNGLVLYEGNIFSHKAEAKKDIKKEKFKIEFGDGFLIGGAILGWAFIPNRLIKLILAFVLFYLAETSPRKTTIFLRLTRIITALEIYGVVIALILKITATPDILAKYFEYFKF